MTGRQNLGLEQAVLPAGKLPVFRTVFAAYRFVFGLPVKLAIAMVLPILLWWVVDWQMLPLITKVLGWVLVPIDQDLPLETRLDAAIAANRLPLLVSKMMETIVLLLPETLFAVAWHRLVLLGPGMASPRVIRPWRSYHWRFFGYFALVTLVFKYPFDPSVFGFFVFQPGVTAASGGGFVPWFMGAILVLWPVAAYCAFRVSLVLPASAVGRRFGLRQSWRATQGQGLRLVIATLFAFLPRLVLLAWVQSESMTSLIAGLRADVPAHYLEIAIELVAWAVFLVSLGVAVTVLSLAFRHLTEWQPPSETDDQEPLGQA
jgi:hypothetical protein